MRLHSITKSIFLLLLLCLAVSVSIAGAGIVFASPRLRVDDDFGVFWISTRLHLSGQNPYDPETLNAALPSIGHRQVTEAAPIMRYAPYVFPLLLPFGLLQYPIARALWFFVSLIVVLFCAQRIWGLYSISTSRWWLPWVLAISFLPVLSMLQKGQVAWWVLAGLVGWVYSIQQSRWLGMGIGLFLVMTKPHLVYLVVIAMFLWIIQHHMWRVALLCGIGMVVGVGIAMTFQRDILQQYVYAMQAYPPFLWATPTLGSWLRWVFGLEHTWLQPLPVLLGLGWLVFRWRTHCQIWRWEEEISSLILISLITTPYAWSLDWVLLLWPILEIGAYLSPSPGAPRLWAALMAYVSINGLAWFFQQRQYGDFWLAWMPFSIFWGYLWLRSERQQR